MARAPHTEIRLRLVIETPVVGVLHSLQDKKGMPIDPWRSVSGEPIIFDFPIRIGAGRKFYGEQVRSEGPKRRFVYVAIGQSAGEHGSPWTRRMKIDIHDIPQALLNAAVEGGALTGTLNGTGKDGTPACATIRPIRWQISR